MGCGVRTRRRQQQLRASRRGRTFVTPTPTRSLARSRRRPRRTTHSPCRTFQQGRSSNPRIRTIPCRNCSCRHCSSCNPRRRSIPCLCYSCPHSTSSAWTIQSWDNNWRHCHKEGGEPRRPCENHEDDTELDAQPQRTLAPARRATHTATSGSLPHLPAVQLTGVAIPGVGHNAPALQLLHADASFDPAILLKLSMNSREAASAGAGRERGPR